MRVRRHLMSGATLLFAAQVCSSLIGCDDRRTLVPLESNQPSSTQPAAVPTTQELISGQPQRVALKAIPFWISVPRGWQLKSQAGIIMLEGPTPSGVAQLQIGRHLAPIKEHAERLIEGAKREAAANPGPYTLAGVRDINGLKALEQRSVGPTQNSPAIDAAGKTVADTSTRMEWKTSVFVPDGRDTVVCEVHFIDLSREQYDRDKDVLSKIMSSLTYDPKVTNN